MKLFIFKPVDEWEFCGGGYVAIAESIDRAAEMFRNSSEYEKRTVFVGANNNPTDWNCAARKNSDIDTWELVEEFPTEETDERIVLLDYNWA